MRVLVGSLNPAKVAAVREVFERRLPDVEVRGVGTSSGVPAQPVSDETFIGAENRARALVRLNADQHLDAHFCVGLEGGITQFNGHWFAFGAICIAAADGRAGFGASPLFELPESITGELLAGTELGDVVDRLAGERDTKQRGGAIGLLTRGRITRRDLYAHGIEMALIPFANEEMYFDIRSRLSRPDARWPAILADPAGVGRQRLNGD